MAELNGDSASLVPIFLGVAQSFWFPHGSRGKQAPLPSLISRRQSHLYALTTLWACGVQGTGSFSSLPQA